MIIETISNAYQTKDFIGSYATAPLRTYNAWFQNQIQESGSAYARTALKVCYVVTAIFAYPTIGTVALFGAAINLCLIYRENKVPSEIDPNKNKTTGNPVDESKTSEPQISLDPVFEKTIGNTQISIVGYAGPITVKSNTIVHLSSLMMNYCKEQSTRSEWNALDGALRNHFFPGRNRDTTKERATPLNLAKLPQVDIDWLRERGIQNIFYAVVTEDTSSMESSIADLSKRRVKEAFSASLELAHENGIKTLAFMDPCGGFIHTIHETIMNEIFESIQTFLQEHPNSFDLIELVFPSPQRLYYDQKYDLQLMRAAKILAHINPSN